MVLGNKVIIVYLIQIMLVSKYGEYSLSVCIFLNYLSSA